MTPADRSLPATSDPRPARLLAALGRRRDQLAQDLALALAGHPSSTLEIGCGHGHFLSAYAAAHPDEMCLGLDLIADRVARAVRKQQVGALRNLVFIKAEAAEALELWPAGASIGRVWLLFPDPWPKKRHHKRRLLQPEFLSLLGARCLPGASLHFRTDDASFFADCAAVLAHHPGWRVNPGAPWPFEHVTVFQSLAPSYQSLTAVRTDLPLGPTTVRPVYPPPAPPLPDQAK